MRSPFRSLIVAAAAVLGCGCAFAQNAYTPVTATQLKVAGVPIPAGTVTFTMVDARGTAVPFTTADGSFNGPLGFTAAIANGVLAAGFTVPDQATATAVTANTPLNYLVQIQRTTAPASSATFTIPASNPLVSGSTAFALDHYSPVQSVPALPPGLAYGATLPAHCIGAGLFYTFSGTSVTGTYACVNGTFRPLPSAGGGTTLSANTCNAGQFANGIAANGTLACNPISQSAVLPDLTKNGSVAYVGSLTGSCPAVSDGDTIKLTTTASGLLTCLNVTTGQTANVSASGVTGGTPGIYLEPSGTLSAPFVAGN